MSAEKIKVTDLSPFPPEENVYRHDSHNMGQNLGHGLHMMFKNHDFEYCPYIILINTITGERVHISLTGFSPCAKDSERAQHMCACPSCKADAQAKWEAACEEEKKANRTPPLFA